MFNWHKKESPILSMLGMGGGIGSKLVGGALATSGGDIDALEPGNGYAYHTFTNPGTFTVGSDLTLEFMIIGGGGGGCSGRTTGLNGGHGGSGIVILRYQIGTLDTNTAKATGGNISFYNGKTIHTFKTSGTFTNTSGAPLAVDHVVIAGGGGGGSQYAGGGGAGGIRSSLFGSGPAGTQDSSFTVGPGVPNAQPVTIGAGGRGAFASAGQKGLNGSNSNWGPGYTATGGGGGAGQSATQGNPGGSGGGNVGGSSPPGGTGVPSQGYPGAHTGNDGAGGGGAGGPGQPGAPGPNTAHGGVGIQLPAAFRDPRVNPFPGSSGLGALGPSNGGFWVCGGGGGSSGPAPTSGKGGGGGGPYSGGGDGFNPAGREGMANTGGGGGGGTGASPVMGGAGGSGLVLIIYPS